MTHHSDTIISSAITMCNRCKIEIAGILKVFCVPAIILLYLSVICLIQLNFDNFQVFAQEVPLIPIQSGNATLDQGLPVFYDCLDNVVDESFNEQEDDYFKHEPRKSEVVECYHKVFVNNINSNGDSNFDTESDDSDDNDEEIETRETRETRETDGLDDENQEEEEEEEEERLFG
jgi:hypothetical protein